MRIPGPWVDFVDVETSLRLLFAGEEFLAFAKGCVHRNIRSAERAIVRRPAFEADVDERIELGEKADVALCDPAAVADGAESKDIAAKCADPSQTPSLSSRRW